MRAAALAGALAAGCGGASAEVEVDCAVQVSWRGQLYLGIGLDPSPGRRLGEGVVPRCEGDPGAPARDVMLTRVRGVDPRVAVTVEGDDDTTYLAPGFLPELVSHPLHDALYDSPRRPPGPEERRCGARFVWRGSIVDTPGGMVLRIRPEGGGEARRLELHARTRVSGLTRAGLPYLRAGDRVVATGRRCIVQGEWVGLANRIRAA